MSESQDSSKWIQPVSPSDGSPVIQNSEEDFQNSKELEQQSSLGDFSHDEDSGEVDQPNKTNPRNDVSEEVEQSSWREVLRDDHSEEVEQSSGREVLHDDDLEEVEQPNEANSHDGDSEEVEQSSSREVPHDDLEKLELPNEANPHDDDSEEVERKISREVHDDHSEEVEQSSSREVRHDDDLEAVEQPNEANPHDDGSEEVERNSSREVLHDDDLEELELPNEANLRDDVSEEVERKPSELLHDDGLEEMEQPNEANPHDDGSGLEDDFLLHSTICAILNAESMKVEILEAQTTIVMDPGPADPQSDEEGPLVFSPRNFSFQKLLNSKTPPALLWGAPSEAARNDSATGIPDDHSDEEWKEWINDLGN